MKPTEILNEEPSAGLPKPQIKMVGVVYKADGTPRIDAGWVEGLDEDEFALAAANLSAHGFDIADFTTKKEMH